MRVAQLILAGLVTGAIYALVTSGLVVVYRASGVLSFAQGSVSAIGAFLLLTFTVNNTALPTVAAVIIAIAGAVVLALVVEAVVIRPLRSAPPLTGTVATLGITLILDGVIQMLWGSSVKLVPPLIQGNAFTVLGFTFTWQRVLIVAVSVGALLALTLFVNRTSIGIAMRAANENPGVASLLGVNLRLTSLVSWGLAGALGGIGAVLIASQVSLTPEAFDNILIESFVAFVLAGFTSILGAVVGGFVVGIAVNLFTGYVSSDLPQTFVLALVLAVLLIKPNGLFGRQEAVRA